MGRAPGDCQPTGDLPWSSRGRGWWEGEVWSLRSVFPVTPQTLSHADSTLLLPPPPEKCGQPPPRTGMRGPVVAPPAVLGQSHQGHRSTRTCAGGQKAAGFLLLCPHCEDGLGEGQGRARVSGLSSARGTSALLGPFCSPFSTQVPLRVISLWTRPGTSRPTTVCPNTTASRVLGTACSRLSPLGRP